MRRPVGGHPVADAAVRLRATGGEVVDTRTDGDGRFAATVEPGEWGFEVDTHERPRYAIIVDVMRALMILLLPLLVSTAQAQESEQVRTLREKIEQLQRENELLKRKIDWLKRLRVFPDGTKPQTAVIQIGGNPKTSHLEGIELPEDATKEQARNYVASILGAAERNRNSYGNDDPEVALLKRVAPSHVDVLVEPLVDVPLLNGSNYLIEALKAVTTEQHKELVLEELPACWELIEVVIERGWVKDAAPTLVRVLSDRQAWSRQTLPTEWVQAVVSLERPGLNDALVNFFYYGDNRYHTWKTIRHVPELKLDAEVAKLWAWAKDLDDAWIRASMAAVAAHYGHLDALEFLFQHASEFPASEAIQSATPYRSEWPDEDKAREWFKANRERLEFDREAGRFKLRESAR